MFLHYLLSCQRQEKMQKLPVDLLPDTIDAFTEIMYAIAKNVASPALISVRNRVPFLSSLCPENSRRNRRPTELLATAMFVLSI